MKIVHDTNLCESHGMCAAVDPDRFELDDNDYLVIHQVEVSDADLPVVQQAVDACPRQALSLTE